MIIRYHKKAFRSSKRTKLRVAFFISILISFLAIAPQLVLKSGFSNEAQAKIGQYLGRPDKTVLRTYIKSSGVAGADRETNIGHLAGSFLANFPSYALPYNKFPQLRIDLKFKEYEKLRNDRLNALNSQYYNDYADESDPYSTIPFGLIVTDNLSWAKGRLTLGEDAAETRIRLKGDMLDHVATKKWSFRVNVRNGGAFLGMTKFNHQGPHTRDFHTETLIHEAMTFRNIIAPRHLFANTVINGNDIGPMFIEEHLSEPMTEYASRPYGPILRYDSFVSSGLKIYDDKMFWNNDKNLERAISNLNYYFGRDVGVTDHFLSHRSDALRHVDLKAWARYLAVTFVYRCFHGNGSNLVFYLHPLKKKMEPISFDNGCGQRSPLRHLGFLPTPEEFVYKLVENLSFRELLTKELKWWRDSSQAYDFIQVAKEREASLRESLSWDAPFLAKFEISTDHIDEIFSWLETFEGKDENEGGLSDATQASSAKKISFSLMREGISLKFIAENVGIYPLKNPKITIEQDQSVHTLDLNEFVTDSYGENFSYDISSLLTTLNPLEGIKNVSFQYEDNENGSILDTSNIYFTYPDQAINSMFPSSIDTINQYFHVDHESQSIIVGSHQTVEIEETLVLPENYSFIVGEGSSLSFHPDASLVVNGGMRISGAADYPVVFSGADEEPWPGILVLADHSDVIINWLTMRGATGQGLAGYDYVGSFTIVEGRVHISDSIFSDNFSEDALNLVNGRGVLERVTITNTPSDGLDIDFGELDIRNSVFSNIGSNTGADAIDMSHASVTISNVKILNPTDKGLSIGESADVEVNGIEISNALVGIAVKDSSSLKARNVKLSDIFLSDVMAYNKKSHYKGATVIIENINSSQPQYLNQHGSSMKIDEVEVEPQRIDVDSLYGSLMQSIK